MLGALFIPALTLAAAADADARVPRLIQALGEDVRNFLQVSTRLVSEETLQHATRDEHGEWKRHTVVSQYSFASPREESRAVREIRQVQAVDGKPLKNNRGLEAVASAVAAGSDKEKLKLLEQWERFGIKTVATDLGQLLLLFSPEGIVNYEFRFQARRFVGTAPVLVFAYSQIDGPGSMTVFKDGAVQKPKLTGEVWVDEKNYRLLRVALHTHVPAEKKLLARQDLIVDYAWWPAGCVMPVSALHREYVNGALRVENRYEYAAYKTFAALNKKK